MITLTLYFKDDKNQVSAVLSFSFPFVLEIHETVLYTFKGALLLQEAI